MASAISPSFSAATVNGYSVKTTAESTPLSGATDTLVSTNISTNTETIENKKIVMGMETSIAFSNVAADLKLQLSHNGTDWADVATLSSDITPDVVEAKPFLVDLTNVYAPYFRFVFNSGSLSVGTSGTAKFFYAFK